MGANFRCRSLFSSRPRAIENLEPRHLMTYLFEPTIDVGRMVTAFEFEDDLYAVRRGQLLKMDFSSQPNSAVPVELRFGDASVHVGNAFPLDDVVLVLGRTVGGDGYRGIWTVDVGQGGIRELARRDSTDLRSPQQVGDAVLFISNFEVRKYDGSSAGIQRVELAEGYRAEELYVLDDESVIVLGSNHERFVYSLWSIDVERNALGTIVRPAEFLMDLGNSRGRRDRPRAFTEYEGRLFLGMNDGLWATDGSSLGTGMLQATAGSSVDAIMNAGEALYFGFDSGGELWRTDGTEGGTTEVVGRRNRLRLDAFLSDASLSDEGVFFTGWSGNLPQQLWQSDGTFEGTFAIASPVVERSASIENLTDFDGKLFYTVDAGEASSSLWVTDVLSGVTREIASRFGHAVPDGNFEFSLLELGGQLVMVDRSDGLIYGIREVLDGDVNLDGTVDLVDFLTLLQHFGDDTDVAWEQGDLNNDGRVDFDDYLALAKSVVDSL